MGINIINIILSKFQFKVSLKEQCDSEHQSRNILKERDFTLGSPKVNVK
jgi:hypothetical protein